MALFGAKQPKISKCSFCGRVLPNIIELADGAVCDDCLTVQGPGWRKNILMVGHTRAAKTMTCNEIYLALQGWEEKKRMLENLTVTRTSESGRIKVDDYQKVFYIDRLTRPIVPRRISDVRDFYLEYKYVEKGIHRKDGSHFSVSSGFITINLNELNDVEEISAPVAKKSFTQRMEVKKVFESDLAFLEELTGKKRKPIPNAIKLL